MGNIKRLRYYSRNKCYNEIIMKKASDKQGYQIISLSKNKKRKTYRVHRLIAKTFIENPQNKKEVNHIDGNKSNNCISNLEWCTRKENLQQSYKTMSPVRNYRECILYKNNQYISAFQSINEACRFAAKQYNASYSMLNKHRKWRDIQIVMK